MRAFLCERRHTRVPDRTGFMHSLAALRVAPVTRRARRGDGSLSRTSAAPLPEGRNHQPWRRADRLFSLQTDSLRY
jgi:hypothetical protein